MTLWWLELQVNGDWVLLIPLMGRDPECPVMDAALSSINQADVLLENTAQLKVKSCSRQEGESELVSANYTIN